MHKQFTIATSLAIIAAALLAGDLRAEDRKTYHASFCLAANGLDSEYYRSEYRITKASGTGTGTLLCPITHDSFECSGIQGCVMSLQADVQVVDNHNTGDVSCTLSVRDATGSSYWYKTAATHDRPGTAETLSLSGEANWAEAASYILKCTLPTNDSNGFTKIFGYSVLEPG